MRSALHLFRRAGPRAGVAPGAKMVRRSQSQQWHVVRLVSVSTLNRSDSGVQSVVDSWRSNCRDPNAWIGKRDADWYTGKPPVAGVCPGVTSEGKITCLPTPNLEKVTRQELRDYFDNTWTATEVLFASLQGEEPFY